MSGAPSPPESTPGPPLWLLAELTYACPLQCPYCSNPLDFARRSGELTTEEWVRVLGEARRLGSVQLGFSGGEPLARRDLEALVESARALGFYTNLITSAVGMDEARLARLRAAGLDHVQVSFQGATEATSDRFAGTTAFEHKLAMARAVKRLGLPLVLNFVLHRGNLEEVGAMLDLALDVGADQVELANTQYYGFALVNRDRLLPTRAQLERAEAVTRTYQARHGARMKILFVVPDYHERRPKRCMNGWGRTFLAVAPDGTALPCQAARELPGLEFPNVRERSLEWIWRDSPAFARFRGEGWMREPCRTCPEREQDLGGCRCQAWQLTGDPANADPVCDKSPFHHRVRAAVEAAEASGGPGPPGELIPRNPARSRALSSPTSPVPTATVPSPGEVRRGG